MGTHTDFQILFSGDAKTVKAACKYADSLLENEYKSGKNPINVYESYQYVWSDDLAKLAFQFIDEVPSLPFTIEAVIDASESAGEYQNVQFEYKDGRLLMRQSCWYLKMYANDYDSFEAFQEEEPGYTEEEFERFRAKQHFILDSGSGPTVDVVPLGEIIVITKEDLESDSDIDPWDVEY